MDEEALSTEEEVALRVLWVDLEQDLIIEHRSDWPAMGFDQHASMMSTHINDLLRRSMPTWQQQFSEIVKAKGMLLGPEPWKKEEA